MQLLKITLYHLDGRQRHVDFQTNQLNIVSGQSRTGKSALLTIVDYCLGRDTARVPAGPISNKVAWFGTLWQLESGSRVFMGRPSFRPGAFSNSRAMIEIGGASLEPPAFEDLEVNTDSNAMRDQVGPQIGLAETKLQPSEFSARPPFTVGLGTAALLCFQDQDEVASRTQLFHRQSEDGVAQTLRDTLPFFLGAVPGDQADRRQKLREARRDLRREQTLLDAAELESLNVDVTLQGLLAEANAVGLSTISETPDVKLALEVLQTIRDAGPSPLNNTADLQSQDARRSLIAERDELRQEMRRLLSDRELLLDRESGEGGYAAAIAMQVSRLTSLNLVTADSDAESHDDHESCPVCLQTLTGSDPSVLELNARLAELREELVDLAASEPARREALRSIDATVSDSRERLRSLESAIATLNADVQSGFGTTDVDQREFVRGRIHATLGRGFALDERTLNEARTRVEAMKNRVRALEEELDDDSTRSVLASRLAELASDMTKLAQQLKLEHSEISVRLDIDRLTVMAETEDGSVPLAAVGSGANWIGYHLVTHLALHMFFVRRGSPVPRILMIDQPTQAYYQSEHSLETGQPTDADREAVLDMFRLFKQVAEELAIGVQIIIVDHANLAEPWFAAAVRHNWRDGLGLLPADWLAD